ncbi:copper resistance protein NlpE [Shewanella sp. FJAT-51649]|uniref:copper resistance protein NlpE n=1 Tax=Shewanella sp. FJAT-51649 TaxID=2864210 RepID=UPI0021AC5977|nr:copper resistance protein NlpE [Shewanella sp. FJAT-51649]
MMAVIITRQSIHQTVKMNMKLSQISLALLALMITACSEPAQTVANEPVAAPHQDTQTNLPLDDTSQNALDWPGVYEGVVPCASCEGIQTTLTLQADNSFELKSIYLGKDESIFKVAGKFDWDSNGSKITLSDGTKYLVGENQLFMLDTDHNKINGELAEHYILKKKGI